MPEVMKVWGYIDQALEELDRIEQTYDPDRHFCAHFYLCEIRKRLDEAKKKLPSLENRRPKAVREG